jgi:hypothetical protein
MKYYLYVADTKVDMLLPQIPVEARNKISTEFKLDLKIFSASRKAEADNTENRFSRLDAVCSFITEYGDVGPVDDPGDYISDVMDMRYEAFFSCVFFGGYRGQVAVGLAGSLKHMIGQATHHDMPPSSDLFSILTNLKLQLKTDDPQSLPPIDGFEELRLENRRRVDTESLEAVRYLAHNMRTPNQKLEFLAKRLLHRPDDGGGTLLATPLYVAIADEPRAFKRRI